jgi:cytochrome P450
VRLGAAAPVWDPFGHSALDDPFPAYREMRESSPVYHNADRGVWALSRFEDVQRAARDWRSYSNAAGVDLDDTTDVFGPGNFIDSDPRRHDELRGLVRHPFTPKTVAELEPQVRARARDLIAAVLAAGGGDIAKVLAWPLPVATVCEVVGFPLEDSDRIQSWVADAIQRLPGEGRTPQSAHRAVGEMHEYFARLTAERRRRPRGDLLSAIATERVAGAPLTDEIAGLCTLLTVAGTETTFSLIGNMVWLLARRPELRRDLARDPATIPAALEEILRCESPVQYLGRVTTCDVEVHGSTIPAGDRVALIFGAANRDESRWERPDDFDPTRDPRRNLAFGEGIHHCLGAPLARLEGRVVLEEITQSMPEFSLSGAAERTRTYTTRGFESLPISVG